MYNTHMYIYNSIYGNYSLVEKIDRNCISFLHKTKPTKCRLYDGFEALASGRSKPMSKAIIYSTND